MRKIAEVVMLGAGGHARAIESWLHASARPANVIEYCEKHDTLRDDLPAIVAIGDNHTRRIVWLDTSNDIHPAWAADAHVANPNSIQASTQVFPLAYISATAYIGDNTVINTGAIVEHDCLVGPHAHVAPGAILCGGACVGEGALVGAGAVITPGKEVKPWTIVKAGTRV
jgi:acetyltransferase-like isoleucine patch superfamily enzyme